MAQDRVIQGPWLDRLEEKMRLRASPAHGFMGQDDRRLIEILSGDDCTVHSLGLTHEQIADRLHLLMEEGRKGWGEPVEVEGAFLVEVQEARGKIACPWPHPGLYRKGMVRLEKKETGEKISYTDLVVHMIHDHGFYQGKGSPFRLEPSALKRILDL